MNGSFLIAITIINFFGGEMPIEIVHGKQKRRGRIVHVTAEYDLKSTGEENDG